MPITNFPGGVSSFGVPMAGQGSLYDMPPGKVWFVNNRTGATTVSATTGTTRDAPFLSIADAIVSIATTNPTQGDTIFVMAGHAENVTASNVFSASLVNTGAVVIPAGTRIIGEGFGNQRPTLTFTAAASTIAFAAASCSIENVILTAPAGSVTVAAALTVTAARCMMRGCDTVCGAGTASVFTTTVSLSAAANLFLALDNYGYVAAGTGAPTSWLSTTGTTGASNVFVQRNTVQMTMGATTAGIVDVSSASVGAPNTWTITDNTFVNMVANATVCIKGVAGWTGIVAYNNFGGGVTTNMTTTSINTPASLMSFQNFCTSGGKWAIVGGGTAAQTS
jgi:hypothetical protein